ncbi:MAG: mitochondrial fission 1 protein [Amphiamblys sp. WSBS2006]|nr:MAG: mitochondrial fission 1 protein [Amphiamblys sp. WSBS2006]
MHHETASVDSEKLQQLKTAYEESVGSPEEDDKRFEYAAVLINSESAEDKTRGVAHLKEMIATGSPNARDSHYLLALGLCRLREYTPARDSIKRLLWLEPENRQAKDLLNKIEEDARKENLIRIGIVGGIGLAIGTVLSVLISRTRK